ncbi:protein containing VTC domain protein [Rhodopirellula baltica SH28]|uniref:Protein containing VTC domain protein n=2 Tax=Rhodopirellula baltica TaxID=265606 RepID=K5DAD9_RHOBT|nr:protein containing VTC domain protein [Rhodopirellula baltica SH28]
MFPAINASRKPSLRPRGVATKNLFPVFNHVMNDKRIELKYQLDSSLALEVKQWAREHLAADPHCKSGDTYDVNSLYLDTPQLDLFHQTGSIGRRKYRVRRYGSESNLWLESKSKKKNEVQKTRCVGSEDEVMNTLWELERASRDSESAPAPKASLGDWFRDQAIKKQLQPTTQIHYRRFARMGSELGQNMRLTIDSQLHASPASGWEVASEEAGSDRTQRVKATELEILELKFHRIMPHRFKELLREFPIPVTGFSKYRAAVRCWNLDQPVPVFDSAIEVSPECDWNTETLSYA